ncbi:hypothetical protein DSM100688_1865 [Bifidobacterium ramosum]|uniref:Uncharacterized protein n=1 Tax=Bifidobacterium ramosum TaxID=1798158 RepID=A0A6L4WXY4_9BIFI|nr:hypothetical protein [Bifidobacterium ramosum]KAB8287090.1 hypothetical protein DSM100688_1865 [Bifidobacterium ramosum]
MAINMGESKVIYQSTEDSDREAAEHPYTVPIPKGLEEDSHPPKPITRAQMMR